MRSIEEISDFIIHLIVSSDNSSDVFPNTNQWLTIMASEKFGVLHALQWVLEDYEKGLDWQKAINIDKLKEFKHKKELKEKKEFEL